MRARFVQSITSVNHSTAQSSVIPANAGIYNLPIILDSRFRGNDTERLYYFLIKLIS